MLRTLALTLCALALAASALAVLAAGPLTASPAVSMFPAVVLDLPAYLLSLAA